MSEILPTLALSVRQPAEYLAGCLKGDACLTTGRPNSVMGYIQLRASDWDFAEAFSDALAAGFSVHHRPRRDERGYAFVRTYNGYGRFNHLLTMRPTSELGRAAWLRGLFDSEGNAQCRPKPKRGPLSWDRRVAMFSTDEGTLAQAADHLTTLSILTSIVPWSSGSGHMGSKPVYAIKLKADRINFARFATLVGSSIARKQGMLTKMETTYVR